MKTQYFLVQLSKPKNVKVATDLEGINSFEPKVEMEQDRFNALFDYCKHNWDEVKFATINHEGFDENGKPINPIFSGISIKDQISKT